MPHIGCLACSDTTRRTTGSEPLCSSDRAHVPAAFFGALASVFAGYSDRKLGAREEARGPKRAASGAHRATTRGAREWHPTVGWPTAAAVDAQEGSSSKASLPLFRSGILGFPSAKLAMVRT